MIARDYSRLIKNTSVAALLAFTLSGCLTGGGESPSTDGDPQPPSNSAPTIQGAPATTVAVGSNYSFVPTASDADGDTLTFSISGRPSWASFNSGTGALTGAPQAGDAGVHSGIGISVTDGTATSSLASFSITVTTVNSAPVISGTPATTVAVGSSYSFTPTASDADGDSLTFSISGRPSWASFNSGTGALTGSPQAGDVGVYTGISISVTDGSDSASLATFSIEVQSISLGSASLSWTAPTENEDGSPLVDLAGYKIYWGTTSGSYPNSVTINNASVTTYLVENLAQGPYEFVATSFNTAGVESAYSNPATKTVM